MPRLLLTLIVAFLSILSACGLSERERAVAAGNDAIREVEALSREVADRIDALSESTLDAEAFVPLRNSLQAYLAGMDRLNSAMRALGEVAPELEPYLTGTFRPAAESAASACQDALDTLAATTSTSDDYRRAVTRIGLCIDRYATAVTNVATEYARLSG